MTWSLGTSLIATELPREASMSSGIPFRMEMPSDDSLDTILCLMTPLSSSSMGQILR